MVRGHDQHRRFAGHKPTTGWCDSSVVRRCGRSAVRGRPMRPPPCGGDRRPTPLPIADVTMAAVMTSRWDRSGC
jgi:hypothetical protein